MSQSISYPFTIFAAQPSTQFAGAAPVIISLHKTANASESSAIVPCMGLGRKIVDVWGTDGQNGILIDLANFAEATEGPEWFTFTNAIVADGPVPVLIPSNSVVGPGPAPQKLYEPECSYLRIRARDPDHLLPRTLKARLRGYWTGEGDWEQRLDWKKYAVNRYCI